MKRFSNALHAQNGACNLTPLTRSLAAAVAECLDEGGTPDTDIACRLIAHQIAHLFSLHEFDHQYEYERAMNECRARAQEATCVTA